MLKNRFITPDWPGDRECEPHDWRKYVSKDVRRIWTDFTPEQRTLLGECFDEIASREEWD